MKRLLILALVAAFVLSAGMASAKEVTMQGQFEYVWQWTDNTDFLEGNDDGNSEDDFGAVQRIRQFFNYVHSENLSGTVEFEFNTDWGQAAAGAGTGGQLGTDGNSFQLSEGYVDFNWPDTELHFRVGLQPLTFPGAVAGTPIWDDDVAGIIASYKVNDNVTVVAGWARLLDDGSAAAANSDEQDEIDAFTVIVPVTMDGFSLTPYFIYANKGKDSEGANGGFASDTLPGLEGINATKFDDNVDVYWIGGAFTLNMFDPLNFAADLIYGNVDGGSNGTHNDREGWFFTALATYKMDAVTPGIFFAYGTGEDDDPNNGSEAFPSLGGAYAPTTFGFDGSALWRGADNALDGGCVEYSAMVIGGGLYGMSFLENVSHDLIVAYGVGTNDSDLTKKWETTAGNLNPDRGAQDGLLLTDEDSFWEVDLNTQYSLYEALTAYMEIGYISVDLDKDSHPALGDLCDKTEDAWKLSLGLKYNY